MTIHYRPPERGVHVMGTVTAACSQVTRRWSASRELVTCGRCRNTHRWREGR